MIITKTVKVYASTYCSKISTDVNDFVDLAIEAGDLCDFDDWITSERTADDLCDLIADYAGQNKTCKELLAFLREDYEDYVREQMEYFFTCRPDEYWTDTIKVEIEIGAV